MLSPASLGSKGSHADNVRDLADRVRGWRSGTIHTNIAYHLPVQSAILPMRSVGETGLAGGSEGE